MKYEPGHPEDQQAFVDAQAPLNRDEGELVDDSLEDRPVQDTNDPETPSLLDGARVRAWQHAAKDQTPQ